MAVFRINKTANYTVLSNYHFKEKKMSLKAKGLLSLMLSLPDSWNYTIAGLVSLSKDGKDSIMSALGELEDFRYLERRRTTDEKGRFTGIEYLIYESPQPIAENPISDIQNAEKAISENPPQLNTNIKLKTKFNKVLKETSKYTEGDNINNFLDILDTIPNDRLRNLYCDFIENRKQSGAPMTRRGLELLIERVREIGGLSEDKQISLLRSAVINGWKNVYPKGEDPTTNPELDGLKKFYMKD